MKTLAVPIHLDALILPHQTVVKDTLADYSRLPYTDKTEDYNPDTPYVGEAILNPPFQDKNLLLNPGVHLHWSLPKAFSQTIGFPLIEKRDLNSLRSLFTPEMTNNADTWTQLQSDIWETILTRPGWIKPVGEKKAIIVDVHQVNQQKFDSGVESLVNQVGWSPIEAETFVEALKKLVNKPVGSDAPSVPDVWLVVRKENDSLAKVWIVESGFIAQTRTAENGNLSAVTVPFHDDRPNNKTQPFRFMGRQIESKTDWRSSRLSGESYLQEVTALGYNPQPGTKGYAEPTFAAFYPNCLSIFGLYDPDIVAEGEGIMYEVLGLYANPENDYLDLFLKDFANHYPEDEKYYETLNEVLSTEFLWKIAPDTPINSNATTPDQVVLFGKTVPKRSDQPSMNQIEIAVGNTGTEALSAYLAWKLEINGVGEKKKVEELLESIQFSAKLQNKVLDIGHKFQEARHDKGFTAFPGGTLWSIKVETEKAQTATDVNEAPHHDVSLPPDINFLLDETNTLQATYDKATREIAHLRRQLFSDWYKYMVGAYPPVDNMTAFFSSDEVLAYIRRESISPLQEKIENVGLVSIAFDENGRFQAARVSGEVDSLANQLVGKLQQLATAISHFNDTKGNDGTSWLEKGKCLALRSTAAPRYWRANDPVVLFAEQAEADQMQVLRNGRHPIPTVTEPVVCYVIDSPVANPADFSMAEASDLLTLISDRFKDVSETGSRESTAIWNPFMLEWEIEFLPAFPASNRETETRLYDHNYVDLHYQLQATDPDLSLIASPDIFQNATLYTGSTILTPHAGVRLDQAIREFVSDHGQNQSAALLQILDRAQQHLTKTNVLSQSLGGFHEALLMQKQTRQLDIADPLGFPEYQTFTVEEVAPWVGKFNLTAPQPLTEFNPIRSGVMKILNLRLIDSFGRTIDFDAPPIVTSETLNLNGEPAAVHLKPRLTQPARLNFRFLSAAAGEQEMNAHPASSPVCGWLLANNLDRSLMVYDQDGEAVGALTMNAANPWRPAPDAVTTTFIDSIGNIHLRRVVRYLFDRQKEDLDTNETADNSFLHHFINALDQAQETIDPENFAEHQDLAILMGKPVAVVRAKLDVELENPPATDQSWTQLTHELQGHGRSSDAFTAVKIPIRLGEYQQLNDGLVGYWLETADGQLGEDYFSSETGDNPDPHIRSYVPGGEPINMRHAIDDAPMFVTMLADPKGDIHAVSGILPVKSITIPKDQYKKALQRIAVTFLTAPVISSAHHLKISLPKEPGYEWTWLEKIPDRRWQEIRQTVLVEKSLFDSKFPDQPNLWHQLVTMKWLQPLEADGQRAVITTAVHRAFPPNETGDPHPFPIDIGKRLDNFFDTYGKRVEPFDGQISFAETQIIREGWLRLRETPDSSPATSDDSDALLPLDAG